MIKRLTLILFILVSFFAFGQGDSTKSEYVKLICPEYTTIYTGYENSIKSLDTSLISSTLLDPEEDIFTPSFFAVNSGLYKFPVKIDFDDYGWMSKNLMLTYDDLEFKTDTTPNIEAKYDQAYANSHWFTASFDRMVGKSKITSKLNRNFQNTLYDNTLAERFNFMIGAELPIRPKYTVQLGYFRNQAEISENGGIYNVDSLKTVDAFNATTIFSNLNTAKNTIFLQKANINQDFKLGNKTNFLFETQYVENKYSFEMSERDIDSAFFPNTFLDTTQTFDSIGFRKLVFIPTLKFSNFELGVNKEFNDKTILNNSFAFAKGRVKLGENAINLEGKYHFENIWNGNFYIKGKTYLSFSKSSGDTTYGLANLSLALNFNKSLPSYIFNTYFGNHFQWDNQFNEVQRLKANALLDLNKVSSFISLEVQNVSNYIYLNTESTPIQTDENITTAKLQFKKQWGKKWVKFYNGMGFQYSTSDVIRIPNYFSRNSLVFDFKLRKVPFSTGTTLSFFSKFKGMNYNPNLRHYHLGKQDVGGTPVIDLFFAARLGPADLYIKYDNSLYTINQNLFIGENYPIYKPYVRLGLKWRLKN